jgi:hypothetical protein
MHAGKLTFEYQKTSQAENEELLFEINQEAIKAKGHRPIQKFGIFEKKSQMFFLRKTLKSTEHGE